MNSTTLTEVRLRRAVAVGQLTGGDERDEVGQRVDGQRHAVQRVAVSSSVIVGSAVITAVTSNATSVTPSTSPTAEQPLRRSAGWSAG